MQSGVVFIGRFQPPHNGHKKAILYLLKKYKTVKIAIGSSDKKRTSSNPFSAKERLFLLKKIISQNEIIQSKPIPKSEKEIKFSILPDNPSDEKWVQNISKKFPKSKFAIFSANSRVRSLLKKAGYSLDPSPFYNRIYWEGTKIRNLIRKNKPYKNRIPKEIQTYIENEDKKIILSPKKK